MNTGRRKINVITIEGLVATIHVDSKRHGHVKVLIDASSIEKIHDRIWHVGKRGHVLYASTNIKRPDGGHKTLLLHHLVTGRPPVGYVIDHISRDALDNRKANLRAITKQSNHFNTAARGYYWHKASGKFRARIALSGKKTHLGYYSTVEEARAAYLSAKEKLHVIVELGDVTHAEVMQ